MRNNFEFKANNNEFDQADPENENSPDISIYINTMPGKLAPNPPQHQPRPFYP